MRKEKLSIDEQIQHMESKGIRFTIVDKESAKVFLRNNTYYFKIKAYAKNFEKYKNGYNKGKYVNLEFAYLKDLSTLDMYFRKFIINMSLDIEHFLKVKLLNDFAENNKEDGYNIVNEFLSVYPIIYDNIYSKSKNSTCKYLIEKYHDEFSIWNIVEVITFGDFIKLYRFYYNYYYDKEEIKFSNFLLCIKFLRNAAAHNNCLLNSFRKPYSQEIWSNKEITKFVSKIPGMTKELKGEKLKNHIIHDFITSLYVFNSVVSSKEIKYKTMKELKELLENRFIKHKEYYEKVDILIDNYKFVKKIIDYFYDLCI